METKRSKEIIEELNRGNTENLQELLKISFELSKKYEPCKCGFIWSIPADFPVVEVIRGEWGDEYPAIKISRPGGINEPAVPYMEKIVYGEIPVEAFEANAAFIVLAVNNYEVHIQTLKDCRNYIHRVSTETVNTGSDYADYDLLDQVESALKQAGEDV